MNMPTMLLKMVPLLNPDGVAAGHFRQDSYGNNLNRHYIDPDAEKHSSVYAAKAVVMHHAARPAGRCLFFLENENIAQKVSGGRRSSREYFSGGLRGFVCVICVACDR